MPTQEECIAEAGRILAAALARIEREQAEEGDALDE